MDSRVRAGSTTRPPFSASKFNPCLTRSSAHPCKLMVIDSLLPEYKWSRLAKGSRYEIEASNRWQRVLTSGFACSQFVQYAESSKKTTCCAAIEIESLQQGLPIGSLQDWHKSMEQHQQASKFADLQIHVFNVCFDTVSPTIQKQSKETAHTIQLFVSQSQAHASDYPPSKRGKTPKRLCWWRCTAYGYVQTA